MPRAGFKFPTLGPRQKDADELGRLREQIAELNQDAAKIEKRLRKCVGKAFHGLQFDVKIWSSSTKKLSKAKLLKYMTQRQLDACYVPGEEKITVKTIRRDQ